MNTVAEKANKIISPIIESLGYEIVEINYDKFYGENTLTIFIYKKGGITLNDCELVNNAIDLVLDENDITMGQSYNLNISSPGLDRPIVSSDDLRRNTDSDIEILFIKPLGKKKQTHGILVSYDENSITLRQKDKDVKFDKTNISLIRPYINFK